MKNNNLDSKKLNEIQNELNDEILKNEVRRKRKK